MQKRRGVFPELRVLDNIPIGRGRGFKAFDADADGRQGQGHEA